MINTNTEPWTGGTDEEYETKHFGFGSQRLKIAVRQMVEQKITNGVKDMESYLQESLQLNDKDMETLTRSCDKLIRLYFERAGPSLNSIDDEIDRIMKVPANVLLPGDECQRVQVTNAEYETLKEEVSALRKRVERAALMEALLNNEEAELASMETLCETAKKDMKVFSALTSESNMTPTASETMFLCGSANVNIINDDIFE